MPRFIYPLFFVLFLIALSACEEEQTPTQQPTLAKKQIDVGMYMTPILDVGQKKYYKFIGHDRGGYNDISYIGYEQISKEIQRYTVYDQNFIPSMTVDTEIRTDTSRLLGIYSYYLIDEKEMKFAPGKITGEMASHQTTGDEVKWAMTWPYSGTIGDTISLTGDRTFNGPTEIFDFKGVKYKTVVFSSEEQMKIYQNGEELQNAVYPGRYRYAKGLGLIEFDYLADGTETATFRLNEIIPDSLFGKK